MWTCSRARRKGDQVVRRKLPQVSPPQTGIGRPTIMDRTLAAQHGIEYVHLAAFAIDVDRVFVVDPAEARLPLGWEVFLCAAYVVGRLDSRAEPGRALIEDSVLQILAAPPGEPRLGGVLAFAVHAAVERGLLVESLRQAFSTWRSPPKQLHRALETSFGDPAPLIARAALHCLGTELTPPLAPPTLQTLQEMAAGGWSLPLP